MSKISGLVMMLAIGAISAMALATEWKFYQGAQISSIVQWEGNSGILIQVAPDAFCHVKPEDKTNIALVMTLYSSGRKADIHCFPTVVNISGINAYPLHRIIAR
jgi:hypothetical protein